MDKTFVTCYVNMLGEKLWICVEDGALTTSINKNHAEKFEKVEDCNDLIKGTILGDEVDGFEFV